MSDAASAGPESSRKLKIAAIRFLNPAPLMWDFEHEPGKSRLASRYSLEWMMPSECAARLALPAGHPDAADIGLVPIAALATTPALSILPGCAIAAKGRIRSLLLIRRAGVELSQLRTVAADTSSRATIAYTQIMSRWWSSQPVAFVPRPPDLNAMLASADAAILIGDPALFAVEDAAAREQRTGETLIYLDLAEAWIARTGAPWISAVWAIRQSSLRAGGRTIEEIAADFTASRDHGLANIDTLVSEWSARIPVPAATIRAYLTSNIYYHLDQECITGLEAFFDLAAKTGILPTYSRELLASSL